MRLPRAIHLFSLLLLTLFSLAEESALTPTAYRQQLEKIRSAAASGRSEEAARLSIGLMNARVKYGNEILPVDRSVLEPITQKSATKSSARLSQLIEELARLESATSISNSRNLAADPSLFERIRESEEHDGPAKSGDLDKLNAKVNKNFVDEVVDSLKSIFAWIGRQISGIFQWLMGLFRSGKFPEGDPESLLPFIIMFILICLGVIALVLLTIWRQNRTRQVPIMSNGNKVTATARDADPLSRGANEWEVYAAELARQGNHREAIRAWYHAVLVTLYRSGVLHYRKGATNWEYCSMLSPRFSWRGSFVELTRQFEREWYGQQNSSAQACDDYSFLARNVLVSARKAGES